MSMLPLIKYASKSFTLPDTCLKLRQVLDDPHSGVEEIAQVMSVDTSLSAKVLRLANSALFRFNSQITSVPKALSVIGGEAAYNISMAETANLAFKTFTSELLDFPTFWEKSVRTGLIAQSLAQQIQKRGSERFFVMGILMHLSELVCATKLEEKYVKYLKSELELMPLERQRKIFGFTFSSCSGQILQNWKLPENLYSSLAMLSLYDKQQLGLEQSILYMAATMAEQDEGQALLSEPALNMQAVHRIGIQDYEYDVIYQFAQAESHKIAQALA